MKLKTKLHKISSHLVRSRRSKTSALTGCLSQTSDLESGLTQSAATFEQQFLLTLTTLEELQDAGQGLSEQSASMLELNQSEKNPINSVSEKLCPNLAFIKSSAHSIESFVESLKANLQRIDATLSFETNLNQTLSQLTYIRTLFAVEAAPLEQNAKVMFTSLVEEIHRLQTDVTEIFKTNFAALRQNRETINALIKDLTQQANNQLTTQRESRLEMDSSIQVQTKELSLDIEANSEIKRQSENIAQSIGTAIISLQTQDIVSQKIQHIFEISDEMRGRFAAISKHKQKEDRCAEYRFLENAALVNVNQIEAIKSELQAADRSINTSIQEITLSIHQMDKSAPRTNSENHAGQKQEARGQSLVRALENAGAILSRSRGFLEQAFKAIKPIRGQTTDVSSTINKLSSQLHLIGLNAEIHAARTGGSTALETLSAKTSGISVETRDLCRDISVQLDSLSEALNINVNALESLLEESISTHTQLQNEIPLEIKNLHQQSELYQNCQTETERSLEKLSELTQTQETRIDFEATMRSELEAFQKSQSQISEYAKTIADRLNIEVSVPEVMNELLSRYTMNSEKEIHLQTLGISAGNPTQTRTASFQNNEANNQPDSSFDDFNFANRSWPEPEKRNTVTKDTSQNVEFF